MSIHSSLTIRTATENDAKALAMLIDIAGEGIPSWLWGRQCGEGQVPLDIGVERARRTSGGFSYKNALIAEHNGRPVGMVLSYPVDEAPEENPDDLPAPIAPFIELEKLSVGTWYINALAVFPGDRGKGIGAELLLAAEKLAKAAENKAVSIQVYGQNSGAVRLYGRLGYRQAAKSPVRHHPCQPYYTGDVLLLIKPLT